MEPNKRINLFLTIAGLAPEFGGPSESVPALAEALARENVDVDLITCESFPQHQAPRLPDAQLVRANVLSLWARRAQWRARNNDFFRALGNFARGNDTVIHDNGLWLPTNHAVATAARFSKRPLLISPRGMLSQWERQYRAWKKKIAWRIFQRSDLFGATALHATSEQEATAFRDIGYDGPIAIVPNGVELPQAPKSEPRTVKGEERIALCVTRLHPKKGLLDLIEAWSEVQPAGWRMVIAGADEDGHRAELEAAIAWRRLTGVFEFVGSVNAEQRQALYNKADLFVLPSRSENFGMSIAEALAHSLPVITTKGTPWKDLMDHRCGWWVEVGVAPLAKALREAVNLSQEQRLQIGQRGREIVVKKYSWSRVAREMKSVYEWLLGYAERPACVLST